MVTKKAIKRRLKRFEVLCGLQYDKEAGEIWLDHLKDDNEERFNRICDKVEKKVKWHILPTLYNYYEQITVKYG
jgi:hypothetical protein